MNDTTSLRQQLLQNLAQRSCALGLSLIVKLILDLLLSLQQIFTKVTSLTKWYEEKFNVVLPIMGLGGELLHIRSQHQIHVTVTSSYRHFNWRRRPCVAVAAERRKEEILLTTLRPIT